MAHYGIPYKGNKSKIAEEILEQLPSGKRLVDLFGGGFAITDCALRNPLQMGKVLLQRFQPFTPTANRGRNPRKIQP